MPKFFFLKQEHGELFVYNAELTRKLHAIQSQPLKKKNKVSHPYVKGESNKDTQWYTWPCAGFTEYQKWSLTADTSVLGFPILDI